MKLKNIISKLFRLSLVICCLMAIATNILSFYKENPSSCIKKNYKTQKQETQKDDRDQPEYSAYEAVVPVLHFNTVFQYYFIFKAFVVEIPSAALITNSPPLFTRSFYRTLFTMIISPNAP